jgi:hypothetical protein
VFRTFLAGEAFEDMNHQISTCLVAIGNPSGLPRSVRISTAFFVWLGISFALTIGALLLVSRIKDGKGKRTLFGWYLILNGVAVSGIAFSVLQPAIAVGAAAVLGAGLRFQWRQVTICEQCGKWLNRARLAGPAKLCPGCGQPIHAK